MNRANSMKFIGLIPLVVVLTLFSCKKDGQIKQEVKHIDLADGELWINSSKVFKSLPVSSVDFTKEALAKIELGKLLYFDKRLSKNGTQSCNSCHDLEKYGVDNLSFSPGDGKGTLGGRNSPTSLNAFLHITQFWDGRAKDVEEQAKGPILNPVEMGMPSAEAVVARISAIPEYVSLFKTAYPGQEIDYNKLTASIGYFERTLVTPSRFDKFLNTDFEALTKEEKIGLQTFIEVGCPTCHAGVAVGGGQYQKFGVYGNYWEATGSKKVDNGKFDLSKNEAEKFVFKVPGLRNVAKTYPYFHDGSVKNLDDAIRIMGKLQLNKDLTDKQVKSIQVFLESLTGEVPASAKKG